jgi:hypothetical protein
VRLHKFLLTGLFIVVAAPVGAQAAATVYHSLYYRSEFLFRSTQFCKGDMKRRADIALGLIGTPEMLAVTNGFPALTKRWMVEGSTAFNDRIMSKGVYGACALAAKVEAGAAGGR